MKLLRKEFLARARGLLALVLLLGALGANFKYTAALALSQMKAILPRLSASEDEKWRFVLGDYYDFIRFVRERTPPAARILLPPSRSSPINLWMHNYFWLPRSIYSDERTARWGSGTIDYIAVLDGWSGFPLSGERMMLDDRRGLIKVKK